MPTCEPKRGHVCGNGSPAPPREKTGVRRPGLQWPAGTSGHLSGLSFRTSQKRLTHPLHPNSRQEGVTLGERLYPPGGQFAIF